MTTDDAVVDVSQDWVMACDVQQRFMQVWFAKIKNASFFGCRSLGMRGRAPLIRVWEGPREALAGIGGPESY